ncbi:MAG: SH3 domain-containing protein [Propionibacteriaceae bacterium]|nr:SH3 domain-containing protein [Propionibacteriaceae bacterium]
MKLASLLSRMTLAWIVATAMIVTTLGFAVVNTAQAATTPYATTGQLNVRTGPSTSVEILMTLKKGDIVLATGGVSNQWLPITFNGKTAYVFAQYVTKTTSKNPAITGLPGKRVTNVNVNLRTKPDLKSDIIKVLKQGVTVEVTGRTSGDFTEVKESNTLRWLYTEYLSVNQDKTPDITPPIVTPPDKPTPTPDTKNLATTTHLLTLRKAASAVSDSLGNVPANSKVELTGLHTDAYSQVSYNQKKGWILTGYFAVTGNAAALPIATGKIYITGTGVNMRSAADVESAKVAVMGFGAELVTTGVKKNSYQSVIWGGKIRWVHTDYVQTKPINTAANLGSTSLNRLERYGKSAVMEIREAFPQIVTIGGWRASSDYSTDHPNGRAIDIMLPNYKQNKALGDKIANWVIKNGNRLHVTYLIWYQRNYTISKGKWTNMANRGSDTQNHKNHVHVSFYPS